MKIGILETGVPPRRLEPEFGRYDAMMADLLGPGFETRTYRVQAGEYPERIDENAGYLLTGSSAGVYDDLPWIVPLVSFLREAKGRTRLVGICFGHQVMAEAFGGRAENSGKGWGLGLHRYHLQARPDWMDAVAGFAAPASHQDQVVALPPGARVLAGSDFAPLGALVYDDQPAMSVQLHPEFRPSFAKALLALGHASRLDPAELDRLSATLDEPNDCANLGAWIGRFFREAEGATMGCRAA